jgi:protein-S-isoprenylcysteine O-methyltransferase Ste14
MLAERVAAILLSVPLLALMSVSISYWIRYGKEEKRGSGKEQIGYNKLYLTLVAVGYLGIWPCWVGAIVLLFLERYAATFRFAVLSSPMASFGQVAGLVVLYAGSLLFAWAIGSAGRYLRPSTSGVHTDHRVVQEGPLGIVRHPYYVSYVLMPVGLALVLTNPWPLPLALCVVVGMGPTARAEEEHLIALFGEEYQKYQQRVGRFFPKLFR